MNRSLIIGIGNTLRGDDGAGVYAAERISPDLPDTDVILTQELHPEFADRIRNYANVLFLDASLRTRRPVVTILDPDAETPRPSSHALSPEGLLSLCRSTYHTLPLRAVLIEIPAFDCDLGETMTEATERMVDLCVDLVPEILAGKGGEKVSSGPDRI
jgi:hydrogenase maturation protease